MAAIKQELRQANFFSIGTLSTILIVTTFISIEPVNTPKQVILALMGFAAWLLILINHDNRSELKKFKALVMFVIVFILLSFLNLIFSKAPFVQTFYGTFGRSTGVLTYFCLAGLLLIYTQFNLANSYFKLVKVIIVAGLINLVYCGIDIIGPDILGWNNTYGPILGTLGNPDFISAFLGLSSVMVLPYVFMKNINWILRAIIFSGFTLALLEIISSKAKQGIVVLVGGSVVVLYLQIKTNPRIQKFTPYYLIASFALGILGVLGTLQIGPLTKILYKTSVSLRGVYWKTGIEMGKAHPVTGIGYDSYGNYYREFRDPQAMILPGPNVVTNAAHNVPIDIFSAGGFPLLISYLGILAFGAIAVFRIIKKMKSFDPLGSALIVGWLGYQAQSFISINQIGLAICGWALTGALIGYERIYSKEPNIATNTRNMPANNSFNSSFAIFLGSILGLVIALPPFVADAGWRSALKRGDGAAIIKVATQWPKDTYRLSNIAIALEKSNLTDEAIVIARENVLFNPRSYDAWKLLIQLSMSTPEEQSRGLEMLHKLDPLNTEHK